MRLAIPVFCLLLGTAAPAAGQEQVTRRGPVPAQDLITLGAETPLDRALGVIRLFSGQVVVDPGHLTNPIGVAIDREPWRDALERIARHHGLKVVQREGYFELLPDETVAAAPSNPDASGLDTREVNISATFFQADRSALREIGVDWSTLRAGTVAVNAGFQGAQQVSRDLFSAGIVKSGGNVNVSALLKTFEENNAGEVVANPKVKVQSGKQGYIQVGSDFSVVTSDFAGNAITQFFSTGTILTVRPAIVSAEGIDFVDLEVEAERSSLVDIERNLVSKTVARTSALLRDGEQTAIGGLYGQEVSHTRAGIPLLKDLPPWMFGLRYVFGHESQHTSKTELIVLLEVDIVPSVRERAEASLQNQPPGDIAREQREAFDRKVESYEQSGK